MGLPLRDEDLLNPDRDPRFDPLMNADAGIRYLAHLLNRFGWNYVLAVAAYNAGPSLVQSDVPSRPETERHVGKVMNFYYRYRNDPTALEGALLRLESLTSPTRRAVTSAPSGTS
jgi:soluble lytic murein transglycosylase